MSKTGLFSKLLIASISLGFTVFVFLNTYEVVFNQDIAVASSLRRFGATEPIDALVKDFDIKPEAGRETSNAPYNRLQSIQIPAISSTLYLEERRVIQGSLYQRPSMGHYIGLNKDNSGYTVDYLIYTDQSWQTLPSPDQIEVGMDVKLTHDGFAQSMFSVKEKKYLPDNSTFVPSKSEKRQLILVVESKNRGMYYAYSLELKD